jgi:lipid II:glycine glycyltransferase (peptidoglycan interpeptide bridge formation enzyme)
MQYVHAKDTLKRKTFTFIFQKNGEDIAGAHYTLKKSFAGIIKTADIDSGIIFKDAPNVEILEFILCHFISWAKRKNASYVRIYPWLPINEEEESGYNSSLILTKFPDLGFEEITKGKGTYWINLENSHEELMKRMSSGTRSKIKKAEKFGYEVEVVETANDELINLFWRFYGNLGQRKGIDILPEQKFKKELTVLLNAKIAKLFIIKHQENILNIALASSIGQSMYFHGALNPDYVSNTEAPSVGHFAQWQVIIHMKSLSLSVYDMAYCPGPIPINDHPNFNIWRFKHGFGGQYVQFMPTFGKALNPLWGRLFRLVRYKHWQ